MGGSSSAFRINVDGNQGPEVNNVEIGAQDSIYIFVSVTINPTVANLPFVIQDSIRVTYNGLSRQVQLDAWGQNANFLRGRTLTGNTVWNNNLPYVILGGLRIDTTATLTIPAGCRIYLHADAPIIIDGSLVVNGNNSRGDTTRVIFQGDRLDRDYRDLPAAWPGIYLRGTARDNIFTHAIIKNAYQSVVLEKPSVNANPKLILNECTIDNGYDAGILCVQSSLRARNCLISNCGLNIGLLRGGDYDFSHCSSVAYSNNFVQHKNPVLYAANFTKENNIVTARPLTAQFRNCLFWGESGLVDNEVVVEKDNGAAHSVTFGATLWRVQSSPANAVFNAADIVNNQNPQFETVNANTRSFDFRLKTGSPAINKGAAIGVAIDQDGKPRVGAPDLGCFEKQ